MVLPPKQSMSEHRETSGRSLASTIKHPQQQPEGISTYTVATSKFRRRKRSSTSSHGTAIETNSTTSRSRSDNTKTLIIESDVRSSRTAQRPSTSPSNMSTVNYTKTGRVSKAKKGLKVHECDCGRSYTRAEHLRRHQRNHAEEGAMICKYPKCGKAFYRSDLLQRHEERHNELGGNVSRPPSISSSAHSAHPSPMAVAASLPVVPANILPAVSFPQQQVLSPQLELSTSSRYNPNQFRTPQLPRTPKVASAKASNHLFQSSSTFKTPPNENKHARNLAYLARHSISGPVQVDGLATSGVWGPESFAQSPYSCSSGYASPAPGPEYGHIYATPPYGAGMVRTRASSNASFIEQTWAHASQSPTSSISVPLSWATDEKSIIASTFDFTPVSYTTVGLPIHASVAAMGPYGQYDPHNWIQMDNEERAQLFPGENYGMSHIARAYPFEQWLNNYWRLFHPTFPIVHQFTFVCLETSPMLYAAMVAIGAHYNNDSNYARDLHGRCLKLFVKRQEQNLFGCDRLCDLQAIFLVEVFALNFARRCARTLSSRFLAMYENLNGLPSADPSVMTDPLLIDSTRKDNVTGRWLQWVKLSVKHRLLVSCYVLESRHFPLIAYDHKSPSNRIVGDDLHFPSHGILWEAPDPHQWSTSAEEFSLAPKRIAEATAGQTVGCYDAFQSSILIAALYGPFSRSTPRLQFAVEQYMSGDATTQQQLAIAKLAQLAPIRALLAVSGKSWILGMKVTLLEEFASYKATLRSWAAQLRSGPVDDYPQPALEALQTSVGIFARSLDTSKPFRPGFGNELGLFYAALVLWAATAAATSRFMASGFLSQQMQPSALSQLSTATVTPPTTLADVADQPTSSSSTGHFARLQQDPLTSSSDRRSSIPHAEIIANTSHFVSTMVEDITSFNVEACQTGCKSLLLWVKMTLRGSHLDEQASTQSDLSTSEHDCGELINGAISQIERMLTHEWKDWGI